MLSPANAMEISMHLKKKKSSKFLLLVLFSLGQACLEEAYAKEVSNPPTTINKKVSMDGVGSFEDSQLGYCIKYTQIEKNFVLSLLKEMEASPYSLEDYIQIPGCLNQGYSRAVKSPMLHLSADSPGKSGDAIEIIYKYYTMKRKQPELWLKAINAKNTEGETFLDYVEMLKRKNRYFGEETQNKIQHIITFACSKGAVYAVYKDKTCQVP